MAGEAGVGILDLENPVFKHFLFYVPLVIAKMMLMSFWTARHRIPNQNFPAPEDYKGAKDVEKKMKPIEAVERVRRAHLNDMENIIPFVLASLCYLFIKPDPETALLHFRVFTGARFMHTVAYLTPLPQPSRALGWLVGYAVIWSMLGQVLAYGFTGGFY